MTHYNNWKRNGIVVNPAAFYLFKAYDNLVVEDDKIRLMEAFPEYFIITYR